MNNPRINKLWENCHHFLLAYHNLTKPSDLERGDPRIPQVGVLGSEGPKYQSYIRWNFDQLKKKDFQISPLYWSKLKLWNSSCPGCKRKWKE